MSAMLGFRLRLHHQPTVVFGGIAATPPSPPYNLIANFDNPRRVVLSGAIPTRAKTRNLMWNEITLIGVGAVLALLGSLVQALVSWRQSSSDNKRELLISAYREYLTGLAERASLLHAHSERTEAATAKMVAGNK